MKSRLSLLLFLLLLSTKPLSAVIGIDQTVSGDKSSSASSISTPVFSTAFGNELLLAFVSADAKRSGMTVTGVSGAGLTWTLVRRTNAQLGTAEIWRAFAVPALSGVSVRASLGQSVAASITVVSFTGTDTSGANGSGAIGAIAGASASSGAPSVTLTTTRANSWVFAVGTDWDRAIPRTPGPGQTLIHQFMPSVGDTYWVQSQNNPTPVAGTSVTINDTAPTSDRYNMSACEILPALSGTTYSLSGTITPATTSSGATVTLSGATNATVTVDASGNYSFSSLANGAYTVTPNKAGFTFSPASQNANVNGANITSLNFTAASATYSLSGTITPATTSSGATVTLRGAANATTTVDTSGNYAFSGLANGTYTITPIKTGFTFSPATQNAIVNGANITSLNFTIASLTYSISGTITPATSSSGATITLSGATNVTATVDASGNYSFSGLANGSYMVTPSKTGFTFSPASQNANVNGANITALNFTIASLGYVIAGTITPATDGSEADVTLSGAANATTTVDGSGNYSFGGLANGTYTITPAKTGFTFSPASQNATVNGANLSSLSFTIASLTYSISGTITPATNSFGATLTLSGAANATTTVDTSGNYTFSGLASGPYTITPTKGGYTFSPTSQMVNVSDANAVAVNFVCALTSGLSIDAVIWSDSNTASTSVTTPAFSTATGGELLLAFISADAKSSGMTVTGVTGAGLSWSLVRRTNAQLGTAEIWRAFAASALSGVSVRAGLSQNVASSITVVSFTGVDPSSTDGSAAIGSVASASSSSGAPTVTLVTTRNNSWVFGVGNDWDNPISRTPGPGQTLVHQFMPSVGDTYWVQRQNNPTSMAGTSVLINDMAPTGDRYNLTACEILPPVPPPGPTYGISGTITPTAIGSGSTVALTGSATATTTADASGSYAFSGLLNGSYTVTPGKSGVTFTPPAQNLTVAEASIAAVNFLAAAAADMWSISGAIISAANGSGTLLTLSGAASMVTMADAVGMFAFSGVSNGSYSVTPSKTGFAFSPAVQGVTVNGANVTGTDFTATATWSISGTITPANSGADTVLALSGDASNTATADASGNYTFTGVSNGSYTVTPSKSGFTFSPASANVTVNSAGVTGMNFTATSLTANFVVDGSKEYQVMDGMGANLNAKSWSDGGNNGAWLDWLITSAGISNVRLVKDRMDWVDSQGTTKPAATLAALEAKDPATFESVYGNDATDPEMSDLWSTVEKLNALGLGGDQISVAFMGYTSKWMSQSGPNCSSSHPGTGGAYGQSWVCDHDAMATMLASLVYYGRVVRGLDFSLISPFNEWNWNGLEGPYLTNANGSATGADWAEVVSRAITKMSAMDASLVNVRFTCCDRAGDNGYGSIYDTAAAAVGSRIAAHAGHAYPGSTAATSIGADASHHGWMTETAVAECSGCDQGGGPSVSEWQYGKDQFDLLLNDVAAGWNSALYWEATDGFWYHHQYDSGGNGWSRWGLMQCTQTTTSPPIIPTCTDNLTPRLRGAALAPLFKAALPGTNRVAVTSPSGVTAVAFHDPVAHVIGISGRNCNSTSVTLSGHFTGMGSTSPAALQAWLTNSTGKNLEIQPDVTVTSGTDFSFTVPADTIFALTYKP